MELFCHCRHTMNPHIVQDFMYIWGCQNLLSCTACFLATCQYMTAGDGRVSKAVKTVWARMGFHRGLPAIFQLPNRVLHSHPCFRASRFSAFPFLHGPGLQPSQDLAPGDRAVGNTCVLEQLLPSPPCFCKPSFLLSHCLSKAIFLR